MTIYLHIGLNKTGSSSGQVFCRENRSLLAKYDLIYPKSGIHDSAHYGVSKLLIGEPANKIVVLPSGLDAEILGAVRDNKSILISSEYFFLASDDQVAQVKKYFDQFGTDLKIVVYLRRHDLWVKSLFNQVLKTLNEQPAWNLDIRDYFIYLLSEKGIEIRYPRILDRWATSFGQENIIVRPFEKSQFRYQEYVWDFLGSINHDLPDYLRKDGAKPLHINESVNQEIIKLIGRVRSSKIDAETKNYVTARLLKSSVHPSDGVTPNQANCTEMFDMPLELRKSIVKFFTDDYREVAERFLHSADQVLFKDPLA